MTISREDKKMLEAVLLPRESMFVESIMDTVFRSSKPWGITASKDDRLAKLEAALIRYILESKS